jgi:hypothetical protein
VATDSCVDRRLSLRMVRACDHSELQNGHRCSHLPWIAILPRPFGHGEPGFPPGMLCLSVKMADMQRASVVGNAGAGKSRFAQRLAAQLGAPWVELDAIHDLADWEPIDPAAFHAAVDKIASTDTWVIDGNYRSVVVDGPVWRRADTVVWLDLPRRTVMRQVTLRSLRRVIRHEQLWNSNQESVRTVASECVLVAHSQAAVDCSAAVAALPGCPEPSSQFIEAHLAVAMNFASPCAFTS